MTQPVIAGRLIPLLAVGLLSTVFLIWFSGSVYSALRGGVEGMGRLAITALTGGVFAAVMIAFGFVASIAGAERAMLVGGLEPGAAATLFDLASLTARGYAFGLAVMLAGFALSGSTAGVPRWFTWSSGVIAIGLLPPVNYIVLGLVVVWAPIMAVIVYRRTSDAPERTDATADTNTRAGL